LIEAAKTQNLQTEECSDSTEEEERKAKLAQQLSRGRKLKASWLAAEQLQGPFGGTNHKKVVLFNRWNLV
jgi:hypothetical protein